MCVRVLGDILESIVASSRATESSAPIHLSVLVMGFVRMKIFATAPLDIQDTIVRQLYAIARTLQTTLFAAVLVLVVHLIVVRALQDIVERIVPILNAME